MERIDAMSGSQFWRGLTCLVDRVDKTCLRENIFRTKAWFQDMKSNFFAIFRLIYRAIVRQLPRHEDMPCRHGRQDMSNPSKKVNILFILFPALNYGNG